MSFYYPLFLFDWQEKTGTMLALLALMSPNPFFAWSYHLTKKIIKSSLTPDKKMIMYFSDNMCKSHKAKSKCEYSLLKGLNYKSPLTNTVPPYSTGTNRNLKTGP